MACILMVGSEVAPFATSGGLAVVLGALPPVLADSGHEVAVIVPRYGSESPQEAERIADFSIRLGSRNYLLRLLKVAGKAQVFQIDCPMLFDRDGLYYDAAGDFPDNHIRFAVLCKAALETARWIFRPQIIHCHDWQSGLVPAYLKGPLAGDPTFYGIKTLFTIHNLGYQGIFPANYTQEVGLDSAQFKSDGVEFYGSLSFLKAGLVYSDALNTVSPTYSREIQTPEFGFGMDGLLRSRSSVLHGILNGIDNAEWNPEDDGYLAANYSASDLKGKEACKLDLLREFGLSEDLETPLIGIVTRLTSQKGSDLIASVVHELMRENVRLVAIGSGEPDYEELFLAMQQLYPDRISIKIGYRDEITHKIEAGADMFLMPSRYEPCGLNQIYSLRYGTLPIVRATGGLDDTIDEGTGFKFWEFSGSALMGAIRSALKTYADREKWNEMMKRAMRKDYSWTVSAAEYSKLYDRLLGN